MSSTTTFAGAIPQNYETYLGPLFFEPYAVDLVERLQRNDCANVLELACGTGRLTAHLIKKIAANGTLIATDLNEGMLRIAEAEIKASRIQWLVADAHNLPFNTNQFDLIVCQFGVMFFADKPKAFAEAFRMLKPSGRFVFNTWNDVQHNDLASLTEKALQEIFPADPPTFFMQGPHSFYDTEKIEQLLQDAGFDQIKLEKVKKISFVASPHDAVRGILEGTPLSNYLRERPEQADKVKQRLSELLAKQAGGTALQLSMEAFVCEAAKPNGNT